MNDSLLRLKSYIDTLLEIQFCYKIYVHNFFHFKNVIIEMYKYAFISDSP